MATVADASGNSPFGAEQALAGKEIRASAQRSGVVTVSDTIPLASCKAIWVGTGGNIAIKHKAGDTAVIYQSVPGGFILPVEIRGGFIMSTDTTASAMVWMDW
jgi:hypothetical protein